MSQSRRFAKYPSLEDRVVVISGGATGIGASLVEEFAVQDSKVIFLDIQKDAAALLCDRLVSERKVKHRPVFYNCDLIDIDGALKPVAAKILAAYPTIHGAAADTRMKSMEITTAQWDQGLNVNLRHQFFLIQALMPGLVAAGESSIINMSSITWLVPGVGLTPYVASKAAIVGLTKTLAYEFGPQGVRVNSILPGAIATQRQLDEVLSEEDKALFLQKQPLKRLLGPEDVSRLALWLVADDGCGVTNQSLVVDASYL